MTEKTFIKACMDHFGKRPGQTLMQFRDELNELTDQDRKDLIEYFKDIGVKVTT
jgi:DNA topoisomerase IB